MSKRARHSFDLLGVLVERDLKVRYKGSVLGVAWGLITPLAVRLVTESGRGRAVARNAGIRESRGAIVVMTHDDVTAPSDWLERLLCPLRDPEVQAVTGKALAAQLDSRQEQLAELHAGPGPGYETFKVDAIWFKRHRRAVPTWQLGGTVNAAFRAEVFRDPRVGHFREPLNGEPSGASHLFHKILKHRGSIVYEPKAVVWCHGGLTTSALRNQVFSSGKEHVTALLATFVEERDVRILTRLFLELPASRVRQLWRLLRETAFGTNEYPMSLALLEAAGNLLGSSAFLCSYGWRIRRK